MSIWSDMGLVNGRMNGVNPCAFLNAAYGFFYDIRYQTWPHREEAHIPEWDFSLRRKAGERHTADWPNWLALGGRLSFPTDQRDLLARPVPESYWNTKPEWDQILTQTEETLLGEDITPCPYSSRLMRTAIMDPNWPLQRYKIIQKMRYMIVPLNIRMKVLGLDRPDYWIDWYRETGWYGNVDTNEFIWNGEGRTGGFIQIEAKIPEYWSKSDTVCKIGIVGGWYYPTAPATPPPVNGCAWHQGKEYLSPTYSGQYSERGIVRIYGVADLSTHPDFAHYFDTNQEEEQ